MGIILPERFNSFIQLPSRDKLSIGDVVTGRLLECKDGYYSNCISGNNCSTINSSRSERKCNV